MIAASAEATESVCRWEGCSARYADARTLHEHVLADHIGSARDGQAVCLQCRWADCREAHSGKVFRRRYSLTSHILVHVPLFQFYCDVCGRGFKRKPDLNKHVPVCKKGAPADDDSEVAAWSKEQVAGWLQGLGLGEHVMLFLDNDIDGRLLLRLQHAFLKTELGVKSAGKREQLLAAVDELRRSARSSAHTYDHHSPTGSQQSGSSHPTDLSQLSPHSSATYASPQSSATASASPLLDPLTGTGLVGGLDLLGWPLEGGAMGGLLDMDLMGPFADFDADFTLPFDLPPPAPASDGGREGQVKRGQEQDEGARKKPMPSATELLASLAHVEAQTQRPWTDQDLGSVLNTYSPEHLQQLEGMLRHLAAGIKDEIDRRTPADWPPPNPRSLPSFAPTPAPAPASRPKKKRPAANRSAPSAPPRPVPAPTSLPELPGLAPGLGGWPGPFVPAAYPWGDLGPMGLAFKPEEPPGLFGGGLAGARPVGVGGGLGTSSLTGAPAGGLQRHSSDTTNARRPLLPRDDSAPAAAPAKDDKKLLFHYYQPKAKPQQEPFRPTFAPRTAIPAFTTPVARLVPKTEPRAEAPLEAEASASDSDSPQTPPALLQPAPVPEDPPSSPDVPHIDTSPPASPHLPAPVAVLAASGPALSPALGTGADRLGSEGSKSKCAITEAIRELRRPKADDQLAGGLARVSLDGKKCCGPDAWLQRLSTQYHVLRRITAYVEQRRAKQDTQ